MDEAKRKIFIERISHALDRNKIPTDTYIPFSHENGPQFKMYQNITQEEVVEMFRKECESNETHLIETTPEKLGEALIAEINYRGAGKVVYPAVPEIEAYKLEEVFKANQDYKHNFVKWDPTLGRDKNICNTQDAQIGITFPELAIAETGTVIQASGVECGRAVSLLPICHISVIKKSTIVPRMTQSMKYLKEKFEKDPSKFPTNICHISGPSRTADIELIRVVGAHGPVYVSFIMVDDL